LLFEDMAERRVAPKGLKTSLLEGMVKVIEVVVVEAVIVVTAASPNLYCFCSCCPGANKCKYTV